MGPAQHTSDGRRREISSERVRPRVSCASRMVRSSPGRPFMSRYWMGARRRGPHPPPLPRLRTRSRSSFKSCNPQARVMGEGPGLFCLTIYLDILQWEGLWNALCVWIRILILQWALDLPLEQSCWAGAEDQSRQAIGKKRSYAVTMQWEEQHQDAKQNLWMANGRWAHSSSFLTHLYRNFELG